MALLRVAACVVLATGTAIADPSPEELAAAPAADQASGVAVARPLDTHPVANGLLWLPRGLIALVLTPPRFAAIRVDHYLESKSPNAFGRDAGKSSWHFKGVADWETALGPSLGLGIGHSLGTAAAVDLYGGLFGARGQSGQLVGTFGHFTSWQLTPQLSIEAGRSMDRVFAGVGETRGAGVDPYLRGGLVTCEARELVGSVGVAAHLAKVAYEVSFEGGVRGTEDGGDHPLTERYDATTLRGFGEDLTFGRLSTAVTFDTRHPTHKWVPAAAPSKGTYARFGYAAERGKGDDTGAYHVGRLTVEAKQLFDLFRGDRVITIAARGETLVDDVMDVPFDSLPSLGGERLRALAMDQLRGRASAWGQIDYAWALGAESRGFLFAEVGEVATAIGVFSFEHLHADYGAGVKLLSGAATTLVAELAVSGRGDVGFLVRLGGL